jgi:tRNA(Ile)-lysidine synthase
MEDQDGGPVVARSALLSLHPALQKRVLREVLRRSGIQLDEAGTKALVEFTRTGASGSSRSLPNGARIVREFDRFRMEVSPHVRREMASTVRAGEENLVLEGPSPGSAEIVRGGHRFAVVWGPQAVSGFQHELRADPGKLAFPLTFRGWEPGDRIHLSYGTKKLKKLLAEARVPLAQRKRILILSDAGDRILWVVGVALSVDMEAQEESRALFIGIRNVTEH